MLHLSEGIMIRRSKDTNHYIQIEDRNFEIASNVLDICFRAWLTAHYSDINICRDSPISIPKDI